MPRNPRRSYYSVCDYRCCPARIWGDEADHGGNKVFCDKHREKMMARNDTNEKERTRRLKVAYYMNYPKGHRLFSYPAHTDGEWKNLELFFDHFNMSWRYRHNGQIVGVEVEKRVTAEIKRREFEQFMDGQPPLPEPSCVTCGAPPADEGV